jgi:hypothetical protein
MTFACLGTRVVWRMGSSILLRFPGGNEDFTFCRRKQMEQLQTRALSHNAPTSSPKHFEQILGLQFAILFFFKVLMMSRD